MTRWLIDKSAYTRLAASADPEQWANRIERGLVCITTVTRLELGFSSRSLTELQHDVKRPPLALLPVEYLTPLIEDRAMSVQTLLAAKGWHRAVRIPDLLIAATADLAGLTVLHMDKDFELVASITGQPVERLALA